MHFVISFHVYNSINNSLAHQRAVVRVDEVSVIMSLQFFKTYGTLNLSFLITTKWMTVL